MSPDKNGSNSKGRTDRKSSKMIDENSAFKSRRKSESKNIMEAEPKTDLRRKSNSSSKEKRDSTSSKINSLSKTIPQERT